MARIGASPQPSDWGRIALTLVALGVDLAGLWLLRTQVLTPPPVPYA